MLEKVENQNARNFLNCHKNLEVITPITDKYDDLYYDAYEKLCEAETNPEVTDDEFSTMLENFDKLCEKRMALLSVKDAYETLLKQINEMDETFNYLEENLTKIKGAL